MSTSKVLVLASLLLLATDLHAQSPNVQVETTGQTLHSAEALEALVAPIALYSDDLLAQVLIAATYPLEVVRAERWAKTHPKLQGEALKRELDKQSWDDSVKWLVAAPSVLSMMGTKLEWTQDLGDAVLAQQSNVMDAIQRLRSKAYANEKLKTSSEQRVTVKQENNKSMVAIESAQPGTIHVPYYDPAVVYGSWPYPEYPPHPYYLDEAYFPGAILGSGIAFGAGYALWRWGDGRFWGGNINWGAGRIDVTRGAHVEHWRHNPRHRHGVGYSNTKVRQQFAAGQPVRPGSKGQVDFRGRDGKQVLKPGGQFSKGAEKHSANRGKANAGGRSKATGQQQRRPQSNRTAQPRPTKSGVSSRNIARSEGRISRGQRHPPGFAARGGHRSAHRNLGGRNFGGRGGRGGGRGGRRSDIALKHNIVLLGHVDNGLGFYRFQYKGVRQVYVGVIAQEVRFVMPKAVTRGADGYLRVDYETLGLQFQTYRQWVSSGGQIHRQSRHGTTAPD